MARKLKAKKIELTRRQVENLWLVLGLLGNLKVSTRMRYAIIRCRQCLEPEVKAMTETLPQPDLREFLSRRATIENDAGLDDEAKRKATEELTTEHADLLKAHHDWEEKWNGFMEESAKVDVFEIPLDCEIDDDVNRPAPGVDRNRQNQAILDALMPVLVDPEE